MGVVLSLSGNIELYAPLTGIHHRIAVALGRRRRRLRLLRLDNIDSHYRHRVDDGVM